MGKFEIELDDEFLIAIGRINVNFALLEQTISFFIWNLVEPDEVTQTFLTHESSPINSPRMWIEFLMSTRTGLEKEPGNRLGQIITAELSFNQKINLLCSIYKDKIKTSKEFEELNLVLRRAAQAEEKRNVIVHSSWTTFVDEKTDAVSRIKAIAKRKGLKLEIKKVDLQELENLADYIAQVAHDIQTLIIRFYNPNFKDEKQVNFQPL